MQKSSARKSRNSEKTKINPNDLGLAFYDIGKRVIVFTHLRVRYDPLYVFDLEQDKFLNQASQEFVSFSIHTPNPLSYLERGFACLPRCSGTLYQSDNPANFTSCGSRCLAARILLAS